MARSIVAILIMLFASIAHSASILVMGDSLSAGYGLRQSDAWPNLLQKKLQDEGYRYEVVNASISGETTAGGRSRIDDALRRTKPSVVIIELGANDGLRGLTLTSMRENLNAMITASKKAGAKVLLIGMRLPPNFGRSFTEKFHQTYSELAKEHKTALVPFLMEGFAEKRELFLNDGIHPTAQAQPIILSTVWPGLKPLLAK